MAVISTEIVPVSIPTTSALLVNPVPGQMNVFDSVVTVAQYDKGGSTVSAFDINGQLNITSTPVAITTSGLSSNPLLPTFSNMLSNVSVSYTVMTNKIGGPIDIGFVKTFGDTPNREMWM